MNFALGMFAPEGLDNFVESLARLNNLSLETAGHYAALIGDTPEIDENGLVVVSTDSGEILARVKMPEESDDFDEFFQCVETAQGWEYQVGVVGWPHPSTPILQWKALRHWQTQPDAASIAEARDSALADPRFFRTCSRCGELNNVGHMHDKEICQACAVLHLGVVY